MQMRALALKLDPHAWTRCSKRCDNRRLMRTISSTPGARGLALAGACAGVMLLGGCGDKGAQQNQARALGNASVLSKTAPLADRLISESEIARASDAAAVQTFLRLWSLLQYQAWTRAADLFQPGLRKAVSDALLTQALSGNLLLWQSSKPVIRSAEVVKGVALIRFLTRNEAGQVVPTSISFERGRAGWLVAYFPALDFALQRAAQLRAQGVIEPLATKPSAAAVRQGADALLLQSTYRERLLRESAAAQRVDRGLTVP
jgi:hypothetical protein